MTAEQGRAVIVTGASSGIGAATSRILVRRGYRVMMAARRAKQLQQLRDEFDGLAEFRATDVRDRDDVLALVDATKRHFGTVDVLVNNAGVMPRSLVTSRRVQEWERMIDVNLKGVLFGIDAVVPEMVQRGGGHIINIASTAGFEVRPTFTVYSATKYGVRALSEGLRQEVARHNIRVTVISPGAVKTELGRSTTDQHVLQMPKPAGLEFLDPETIANAVHYVLEQPSSVCVGELVIRPTTQT